MYCSADEASKEKQKFNFDRSSLLPFIIQLSTSAKKCFDHYVQLRMAGMEVNASMLATFLEIQMASWNPQIGRASVLDTVTKKHAAHFVAGVVFNIAQSQEK